jgi:uncharacterized protein
MLAGLSHNSVGLGLRRGMLEQLKSLSPGDIDFMEVAPENWIGVGGRLGKEFRALTERFPFVCHGLSLSLGSPAALDENFVREIKSFLDQHHIRGYSEHLSYCSDHGHLYDLMPIPYTEEAVFYVAQRIKRVQDILERSLIIENVSAYLMPGQKMAEQDFINAVLQEADCQLLLDVNNVYVNSVNHGFDAQAYITAMPCERIAYYHIAGHFDEAEDLLIDTHGDAVKNQVWDLLQHAYTHLGVAPTLLERDFNFPHLSELLRETNKIRSYQMQTFPSLVSEAGIGYV